MDLIFSLTLNIINIFLFCIVGAIYVSNGFIKYRQTKVSRDIDKVHEIKEAKFYILLGIFWIVMTFFEATVLILRL